MYLLSLLNEESGIMELPTQKRKRVECPSTSSSSEVNLKNTCFYCICCSSVIPLMMKCAHNRSLMLFNI